MGERLRALVAPTLAYVVLAGLIGAFITMYLPVRVEGGSMSPALVPGDIVVVSRHAAPRVGDIVLFESGVSEILHRVERVMPGGRIVTRGDANPVHDVVPTSPASVRGVAVRVIPLGRLLARWR